jgi:hypothetical protein
MGRAVYPLARTQMLRGSDIVPMSIYPVSDRHLQEKAHAHGPGAHVIILSGKGYSLMWPEGEEPRRYN